jgi:hypothetical protein
MSISERITSTGGQDIGDPPAHIPSTSHTGHPLCGDAA